MPDVILRERSGIESAECQHSFSQLNVRSPPIGCGVLSGHFDFLKVIAVVTT